MMGLCACWGGGCAVTGRLCSIPGFYPPNANIVPPSLCQLQTSTDFQRLDWTEARAVRIWEVCQSQRRSTSGLALGCAPRVRVGCGERRWLPAQASSELRSCFPPASTPLFSWSPPLPFPFCPTSSPGLPHFYLLLFLLYYSLGRLSCLDVPTDCWVLSFIRCVENNLLPIAIQTLQCTFPSITPFPIDF